MTITATPSAKGCSKPLQHISNSQFQRALDVFNLGTFRAVNIPAKGFSGQTVKLSSSKGTFYFRGKPRFHGQFQKEQFFADVLHTKTNVPVPHPYLQSLDRDIFGWEYAIIPAMPGYHVTHRDPSNMPFHLTDSDWLHVAQAQASILKEAQRATHTHCGDDFDPANNTVKPYTPDWLSFFKRRIIAILKLPEQPPSREDVSWAKNIIEEAAGYVQPFTPCVFFQDFKYDNMLFDCMNGQWCITALFDFAEISFGHPEADLARLFMYYGTRAPKLAQQFIASYLDDHEDPSLFVKRFPLFILHDRALVWHSSIRRGYMPSNETFKPWASKALRHIDLIQEMLY